MKNVIGIAKELPVILYRAVELAFAAFIVVIWLTVKRFTGQ